MRRNTIICFHRPDEENGYLSNWYPSAFKVGGVTFSSMEQYMMYQKALCFHNKATAAQILATDDVAKVKALGRLVSNYDESTWNGVRQIIVFEGLLAKLSQNESLKEKLKATGNAREKNFARWIADIRLTTEKQLRTVILTF